MNDKKRLESAENVLIKYGRDYGDIAAQIRRLFKENGKWQDDCLKQTITIGKLRDEIKRLKYQLSGGR